LVPAPVTLWARPFGANRGGVQRGVSLVQDSSAVGVDRVFGEATAIAAPAAARRVTASRASRRVSLVADTNCAVRAVGKKAPMNS
jgi:hypothetical protein